jgi:hypothetical protein
MAQVAEMSQAFAAGSKQTAGSAAEITELAGEFSVAISQFDLTGSPGVEDRWVGLPPGRGLDSQVQAPEPEDSPTNS